MKFGLIGYGAWGRNHPRIINSVPGAECVAIACNTERTAEAARHENPGVAVYSNYRDLLKDPDVEVCDIVLPNYLHCEVGVAALEAGKNVLLQKPMARTPEECDRLIEAANRSGRVLGIAHDYRAASQWIRIREMIAKGEIGAPLYISLNLFRNQFRQGSDDWRFTPEKVGSWVIEEPVHFVDLILWFMEPHGDPVSVYARANSRRGDPDLVDNFTCIVNFKGGAYAVTTHSVAGFNHHAQFQAVGTEGAIRTTWSAATDRTEGPASVFEYRPKGMPFERGVNECLVVKDHKAESEGERFRGQVRRVLEMFPKGIAPMSGEEGRKRIVVGAAAERSLREGREIPLEWR